MSADEALRLTKEEFCTRFVSYMVSHASFDKFDDDENGPGESVADYAKATAPTYWEEQHKDGESPEECAAADMSYWGED